MSYIRQSPHGLLILNKPAPPVIKRSDAWCVLILLPARQVKTAGGILLAEQAEHWERMTSNGAVIRCHTRLEAEEAMTLARTGIDDGHFKDVAIVSYDPCKDDLPYHEWVRGTRGRHLAALGMSEDELPESQDATVVAMSDSEWLSGGPR